MAVTVIRYSADPAAEQRSGQRPRVPGDDALAAAHPHAGDVHELRVLGEDRPDRACVLGVQRGLERADDLAGLSEMRSSLADDRITDGDEDRLRVKS
jgi:hypothetical protein